MVELNQFLKEVSHQSEYLAHDESEKSSNLVEKMNQNHRLKDTYTFYLLFQLSKEPQELKNMFKKYVWLQKELVNALNVVKMNEPKWLKEIKTNWFDDPSLNEEERLQELNKSMQTLKNSVRMREERNKNEKLQAYLTQKIKNYKDKTAS